MKTTSVLLTCLVVLSALFMLPGIATAQCAKGPNGFEGNQLDPDQIMQMMSMEFDDRLRNPVTGTKRWVAGNQFAGVNNANPSFHNVDNDLDGIPDTDMFSLLAAIVGVNAGADGEPPLSAYTGISQANLDAIRVAYQTNLANMRGWETTIQGLELFANITAPIAGSINNTSRFNIVTKQRLRIHYSGPFCIGAGDLDIDVPPLFTDGTINDPYTNTVDVKGVVNSIVDEISPVLRENFLQMMAMYMTIGSAQQTTYIRKVAAVFINNVLQSYIVDLLRSVGGFTVTGVSYSGAPASTFTYLNDAGAIGDLTVAGTLTGGITGTLTGIIRRTVLDATITRFQNKLTCGAIASDPDRTIFNFTGGGGPPYVGANMVTNCFANEARSTLQGGGITFTAPYHCYNGLITYTNNCQTALLQATGTGPNASAVPYATIGASWTAQRPDREGFLISEGISSPPLRFEGQPSDKLAPIAATVNLGSGVSVVGGSGARTYEWWWFDRLGCQDFKTDTCDNNNNAKCEEPFEEGAGFGIVNVGLPTVSTGNFNFNLVNVQPQEGAVQGATTNYPCNDNQVAGAASTCGQPAVGASCQPLHPLNTGNEGNYAVTICDSLWRRTSHMMELVVSGTAVPVTVTNAVINSPTRMTVTVFANGGTGLPLNATYRTLLTNWTVSGTAMGTWTPNPSTVTMLSNTSYQLDFPAGSTPCIGGNITVTAGGSIVDANGFPLGIPNSFTITGVAVGAAAPTVTGVTINGLAACGSTQVSPVSSVIVTFSGPVLNVVPSSLSVGGSAATTVTGTGPYTFSGFTSPPGGATTLVLDAGIIKNAAGCNLQAGINCSFTAPSPAFNLTYVATPVAGGTITGPATVAAAPATAAITLTTNPGYTYASLGTTNGTLSGAFPNFTLSNVTANATLTATWTPNTNNITYAASPVAGGTLTGPATIVTGNTGAMVATQAAGYTYASISATAGATVTGTYPNFTLNGVTAATTVTAVFTPNVNTITRVVTPAAAGTLTGPATVTTGTTGAYVATTNAGYTYASIAATAGATVTGAYPNFTLNGVTAATTITATYTPNVNAITYVASPVAGGTLTGPATITTGTTGAMTATQAAGYTYASISATAGATVTGAYPAFTLNGVTAATTVTAVFTPNTNNITYVHAPVAGGTHTGPATVVTGTSAALTATANVGYSFTSVSASNGATVTGTYPNFTLSNVTAATTVTFNWTVAATWNLTYVATPAAAGTVTGPATILQVGGSAVVNVTTNAGYTFVGVTSTTGTFSGSFPTFTLTGVTANSTVTATWTPNANAITVVRNPIAGGTLTAPATVNTGATAALTATTSAGYTYSAITATVGTITGTFPNFTLSAVNAPTTVTITWTPNVNTITRVVAPAAAGTLTGPATVTTGTTGAYTATTNVGYTYSSIAATAGATVTGTYPNFTLNGVTAATTITATYTPNANAITYVVTPAAGGSFTTAPATVNTGATANIVAAVNAGYTFGSTVASSGTLTGPFPNYTLTGVTGPVTVTLTVTANVNNVTRVVNPAAAGTLTGPATVTTGTTGAYVATTNAGYTFSSIAATAGATVTGAYPNFTLNGVTAATTITATYTPNANAITYVVTPAAGGSFTTAPATVNTGATANIVAAVNPGYTFGSTVATSGTLTGPFPNYTLTGVTGPVTVTLTVTANVNNVTRVVNPVAAGTLTGPATVTTGTTGAYVATTNAGYTFSAISANAGATVTGTYPNFTLNGVTAATTITATYTANVNTITRVVTPAAAGTLTGPATITTGSTGAYVATTNAGYTYTSIAATAGATVTGTYPNFTLNGVTADTTITATYTANTNNITYVHSPVAGGSHTGPATVVTGNTGALTATANVGYTILSVTATAGATVTGTYPNFTLNGVTAATTVTFNWTLAPTWNLTYVAAPVAGGTVTGPATILQTGGSAAITATTNPGYTFTTLTASTGTVAGTYPNFTLTLVTANTTVTANYTANTNTITVTRVPVAGGTLTAPASVVTGNTAAMTATTNAGYTYASITTTSGSVTGTYPNFTLTGVTANTTVTITWTANTNALTYGVTPAGAGTLTGPATVVTGNTAAMVATTTAGYTYTSIAATAGATVTGTYPNFTLNGVTAATTVTATYTPNANNITVTRVPVAGGTLTAPATVNTGATAALTATTNPGYTYVSIGATVGTITGTFPNFTLSGVNAATTVTITWSANSNAISYAVTPAGSGTLTGPATITTGNTGALTATTTAGYTYTSIAATAGATVTGTYPNFTLNGVTAATSVTATFTPNANAITVTRVPVLGGTLSAPATIDTGTSAGLTATTNAGYTYTSITATNGTITGVYPSFTLSGVTAATTVTITWTASSNAITYVASPGVGGTLTGPATITTGNTGAMVATQAAGYTYASISATAGATITGTYPNFTLNGVTAATTVTAVFNPNTNAITYAASPVAAGTLTGPASIVTGNTGALTATTNAGYTFSSIAATAGATVTGTYPNFTLNGVTAATTVTATYTPNANSITVTRVPVAGGTLSAPATVNTGSTAALTATTNAGYTFVSINASNGTITGTFPNYTLSGVTANTIVTITWSANSNAITYVAVPVAGGTVSGPATVLTGATGAVTVTENAGYNLISITATAGATVAGTVPNFTLSGVTAATTVTATFTLAPTWNLTYVANPVAGGTLTGPASILQAGGTAALTATQAVGYTFATITSTTGTITGTYPNFTLSAVTADSTVTANFTANLNAITVVRNPVAGGTLTAPASVATGSTAALTATTNAGYTYASIASTSGSITGTYPNFTLSGVTVPVTVTITWTPNVNAITYASAPAAGGTASGPATVTTGNTGVVNVSANVGYTYASIGATAGATLTGTFPTFTLNGVTAATTVTANFTANSNNVTYVVSPAAAGTLTGPATVLTGATAALTATTNTGYTFSSIAATAGATVTGVYPSFTLSGATVATTVTATYTANANAITVTRVPVAGGTLSAPATVNTGSTAALTATTNPGYTFTTINATVGTVTGAFPNFTLSGVNAATNVTITWTANTNAITYVAAPVAGGTVTGPATVLTGATAALIVTENVGWNIQSITATAGATVTGTFPNYTLSGATAATTVTATFTNAPTWNLSYASSPAAGGTVTGPASIFQTIGTTASLTVTENAGYTFSSIASTPAGATFTGSFPNFTLGSVAADTLVTATFTANVNTITINRNPIAGGTLTGPATVNTGATAALTATTNAGYTFATISASNGTVTGAFPNFTLSGVTVDTTVTINWTPNTNNITYVAVTPAMGSVTGGATVVTGSTTAVTVTENVGFSLISIVASNGATVTGTFPTYTLSNVTANTTVTATFGAGSTWNLSYVATPAAGGTVSGPAAVLQVAAPPATVTVTQNAGYTFVGVTSTTGTITGTFPTFSLTGVSADSTITATFTANSNAITVVRNPVAGGTVTAPATVNTGATAAVNVTENAGYTFVSIAASNGTITGALPNFTLSGVTAATTVTVTWSANTNNVTYVAVTGAMGTVTGPATVVTGSTGTVFVTENAGFSLVSIVATNGTLTLSGTLTYTLSNVTADTTVTATFGAGASWPLTYVNSPVAGGTLTGPGSILQLVGTTVNFTASANAGYAISTVTASNGAVISGTYPNYILANVTAATTVTATWLSTAIVINPQPTDQLNVAPGASVSFTLTASSAFGPLSYQWTYPVGAGIQSGSDLTDTLVITSASAADVGSYFCTVTDDTTLETLDSDTVQLTLQATSGLPALGLMGLGALATALAAAGARTTRRRKK